MIHQTVSRFSSPSNNNINWKQKLNYLLYHDEKTRFSWITWFEMKTWPDLQLSVNAVRDTTHVSNIKINNVRAPWTCDEILLDNNSLSWYPESDMFIKGRSGTCVPPVVFCPTVNFSKSLGTTSVMSRIFEWE